MSLLDSFANTYVSPFGEYTEEQKQIINKWRNELEKDRLDQTPFRDTAFLETFLKTIPEGEQFKYVFNTNNYHCASGEFDPSYVLVTRRAIPSDTPKPEQYWTDDHTTALLGLRNELPPKSPQRMHSVIMVSTLQKLREHGKPLEEEFREKGASDGEIEINSKPFSSDNFLFTYKPAEEQKELDKYLSAGGLSREDVLSELKDRHTEHDPGSEESEIKKL